MSVDLFWLYSLRWNPQPVSHKQEATNALGDCVAETLLSAYLFKLAFRNSPTLGKAVERGTFASCDRNLSRFCTSTAAAAITMVAVQLL